jgi:protein-L-isoaspartate(D-aspartate) O-methyltransferase
MASLFETLTTRLGYFLSLPERTIRALAAGAGGMTKVLTDSLFPDALRGGTFYRVVLGDVQRFVIEKVGDVKGQYAPARSEAEVVSSVQRKLASQAVDAVGLFALHVSPLWIFAIASDVAAGSRVYLQRLVESLQRQGVIDASAAPTSVEQLLGQIQAAAAKSTQLLDEPPVSRQEAIDATRDLLAHYRGAFSGMTNLLPRIDGLWEQMRSLAARDRISIEQLSGLMSLDVVQSGGRVVDAAFVVGKTTGEMLGETLLSGYGRTLTTIRQEGLWGFTKERLGPFLSAAAGHFGGDTPTWTQKALAWLLPGRRESSGMADSPGAPAQDTHADARRRMVQEQLRDRGIRDERVLAAMAEVPRERFAGPDNLASAYEDRALPIGSGQTISQPYMVAAMTAALRLEPGHRVLEVGTGSGYQTAILAKLAREVYTIERIADLSCEAATLLGALGFTNVVYRIGDGTLGWLEAAPFDRILVTAGAPQIPQPLVDQLVEGGCLVVPVGPPSGQTLVAVERFGDKTVEHPMMGCRFVPLVGQAGWSDASPPTE